MQAQATMPQLSIEQIVQQIFYSRKITRIDQRRFMYAMLTKDTLNQAEQNLVSRVFDALQKGAIRVVD